MHSYRQKKTGFRQDVEIPFLPRTRLERMTYCLGGSCQIDYLFTGIFVAVPAGAFVRLFELSFAILLVFR